MADDVEWYSPNEPPNYDLPVLMRIGRRVVRGGLILHRKRRCPVWVQQHGRRMILMRAPPDAWRPVRPTPDARRTSKPSPAFEAARERLSAVPAPAEAPPVDPRAWWLDPAEVRYSPPGAVTPRECEGRLMRALMTARTTKMENPRGPRSNSDWIAKMVAKFEIENGIRERPTYWHDRHQPTARDISDCTVALGWMFGGIGNIRSDDIAYQMLEIISFRSYVPRKSYREISELKDMPKSPEKVARVYKAAMTLVLRAANGVGDAADSRPTKATVSA